MGLAGVTRHEPVTVDADRRVAVIAPAMLRDERSHVLFTKRANHLGGHPGQMGFPGDGHELNGADLRATTLRESNREIGLRPGEVAFHGYLDGIQTVADRTISPPVAAVPDRAYEPDQREMTGIAVLAVGDLIDRTDYESERRDYPQYGEIRFHFFHADGYTVWGAIGRVLAQLLELTTDWRVPEGVDRVVDPDAGYPV